MNSSNVISLNKKDTLIHYVTLDTHHQTPKLYMETEVGLEGRCLTYGKCKEEDNPTPNLFGVFQSTYSFSPYNCAIPTPTPGATTPWGSIEWQWEWVASLKSHWKQPL